MQPTLTRVLARMLCLALVLALPLPVMAQSQSTGGAIGGTIADESGAVMPGVTVTVRNQGTGLVREAVTDSTGAYRAPLLPVGTYEVKAVLAGFAPVERPNIVLNIGGNLSVDLQLKVKGTEETVVVTAEAPIVEVNRTHQASTVGAQSVANLPVNGRNFIDFVLTTPGVVRDVRTGDISFAGQRGTLNSLVIDGADNNNTFFGQTLGRTGSGRAPYQFSQDAVQEFQVNRNAYSAEYGRAGGAVINVVTKSGTNDFHGSVFEFFRDKDLNGNTYANKIVAPVRDRTPFKVNQFGGSLGGPIVKDKAFFFVSVDSQRQTIPNDISLTIPAGLPGDAGTAAGLALVQSKAESYSLTRDQDVFLAKVDWQLDQRHRLSVRYNHQNFTGANSENSGVTNAEEHSGDSLVRTRTLNGSLTSVLGTTFFNELKAQWAKDAEPGLTNTNDPEVVARQSGQGLLTFGRNNFSPRETTIKRIQIADSVTLIRGMHSLKLGADYNHDQILNFFPGFFGGSYTFQSLADLASGRPSAANEFYQQNFAGVGTTGAETHPDINEFAAFLQDEWRARKNVTISLGLRYDIQSFAKPAVQNPDAQLAAAGIDTSFLKTDKNNIGPRLGIAWSPNAKTVVRAGYGLFYGRTPSIMVGTAHSNNGVNVISVRLTGNNVPTYPATLAAPPSGIAGVKPSIFIFDPDYQNPMVHQASAGIEYALSDDVAIAGSYLFVAGRDLQRSRDFNVGTPVPTAIPIAGGGSVTIQQFPTTRPFSNFDRIIRFESTAESNYNGATLELRRRFRGHFQGSLAYTLGKVTDTAPDATAVVPGNAGDDAKYPSNPADFQADDAAGNNDVRHRVVFSGLWDLSYFKDSNAALKAILNNWSISWIASYQSGLPYSDRIANDVNRDGNPSNDIVPGTRNSERLPGQFLIDMRLSRKISIGPKAKLELIAEAFNLLNHTVINSQRTTLYSFTGGQLVPQLNLSNPRLNFGFDATAADPRIVQIAAKVTF